MKCMILLQRTDKRPLYALHYVVGDHPGEKELRRDKLKNMLAHIKGYYPASINNLLNNMPIGEDKNFIYNTYNGIMDLWSLERLEKFFEIANRNNWTLITEVHNVETFEE